MAASTVTRTVSGSLSCDITENTATRKDQPCQPFTTTQTVPNGRLICQILGPGATTLFKDRECQPVTNTRVTSGANGFSTVCDVAAPGATTNPGLPCGPTTLTQIINSNGNLTCHVIGGDGVTQGSSLSCVAPVAAAVQQSLTNSEAGQIASVASASGTVPTMTSGATSPGVSPKPSTGLSGGAIAGIAIGMLVAGIFFAGIVFCFLLRRQKKKRYHTADSNHLPPVGYASKSEKGPTVVATAVPSSIDNLLPQPASDETLTSELSRIRDNIKNHVRTFYHSSSASGAIDDAALANVAAAAGVSTPTLVGALSVLATRQEALRLVIAWVVLSKATGGKNAGLLPANLASLTATISSTESTTSHAALYSKWKTITSALLQKQIGKNAQPSANVIAELDSILAPFVQGSLDGGQRRKNLDMILGRSANFAFLLFSQPGSFVFDFSSPHGGLATFPAFLQTVGDQGQAINPPRMLLEGELVAV